MGKGRTATKVRPARRGGAKRKRARPAAAPPGARGAASKKAGSPKQSVEASPPAKTGLRWRGPSSSAATCPSAVRASTPADAPAIAALWMEMNRLHAPLGEEWIVVEGAAEKFARLTAAAAGNPRTIFLVAELEIDGAWRTVGFAQAAIKLRHSLYLHSVVGEIPAICVAPDACGRGIGSALVAAAMDWFKTRGVSHVETPAAAANTTARAFWRANGFRESTCTMCAGIS